MKALILILITIGSAAAQSIIPQAVKETISLSPKCQRGELQSYRLATEMLFLTDEGYPKSIKRSFIDYTQTCLINNPDSGLVYEVTIDSFVVGGQNALGGTVSSKSVVSLYDGLTIKNRFTRIIPVKGGCYDYDIPLEGDHHYSEDYEFLENYIPVKLLEQLRYTAGRRLSQVGDTATIVLPKPICYKIREVINESRLVQAPLKLKLAGLTSHRGNPCAIVTIDSDISPMSVEIYSTDTSSFKAAGASWSTGEFLISLPKGQIVSATLKDRTDAKLDLPDGTSKPNRVMRTITLTQKN